MARARVVSFVAMVYAPQGVGSRLVQVEACERGFPFYGRIQTDPADAFTNLSAGGAVVDSALLTELGVKVGDTVALGGARLTIRGTIVRVPATSAPESPWAPCLH